VAQNLASAKVVDLAFNEQVGTLRVVGGEEAIWLL
jgi:hypothetical protein